MARPEAVSFNAGAHGAWVDMLAEFIEKRKLATGLIEAAPQPNPLDGGRRVALCLRNNMHGFPSLL
jgi:hypothetical protein